MPCFDKSVYLKESSSPARTYHTYMCQSRDSYSIEHNSKLLEHVNYDYIWNRPEAMQHNKPPHISKLRHILSETISNITKGNSLKQGESVELTLEIELMNTESNTPANSLVEVTIIQHNKHDHNDSPLKILTHKMPLQLESNSTNSESASQKRRNWFKRVINKPNGVSSQAYLKTTTELYKKNYWKYNQETLGVNNKQSKKSPKNNFVTILPQEIPTNMDYAKGYRRVSPERKTPIQKPKNVMNPPKKETVGLVKKLSDVFLPSKLYDKNTPTKPVSNTLKSEVVIIQTTEEQDKGQLKGKKPAIHNFGKIVDNILGGIMETSNNNRIIKSKANTLPIHYQQFFEPVSKPKSKTLNKKKKIKEKLTNSHSDTCCVNFKNNFSGPKLKKSNSTSDCKAKKDPNQTSSYNSGDLKRSRTGTDKIKRSKRLHKRNEKGDTLRQSSSKEKAIKRSQRKKRSLHSQNSMIEWNGQKIRVNKEIKTRIEMIIVNELQNLALKEGMECDVTPLPSTETSSNTVNSIEKVSSFVCELDISDRKIKKLIKNKKSSEKKLSDSQSSNTQSNKLNSNPERKFHDKVEILFKEKVETVINSMSQGTYNEKASQENLDESQNSITIKGARSTEAIITSSFIDENSNNNGMEITFVNKYARKWSDESTNFNFKGLSKTVQGKTKIFKSEDTEQTIGKENKPCDKILTTGFVKKIDSNDSNWNNFSRLKTASSGKLVNLAVSTTKSTIVFSSTTTHEYASSIEIELDIKDLESILKEAKQKQRAEKVLINARCKQESKQQQNKVMKLSGKNSPSYTNRLLKDASRKLEKYTKGKRK